MKTTNTAGRLRAATRLLLGCGVALAAGCTIIDRTAASDSGQKDEAEYEYVYTTGSNIPVKILKGTQRTKDARTQKDQAELRRLQELQANPGKPKGN